jgi:hypothetical protein
MAEEPRIAVFALLESAPDNETNWLATCYQLTPRVARLSATRVAMDLGPCTEQEALDVARQLTDRLGWNGVSGRIGIGSTLPVAQLALLTCPASQRIALVTTSALPAFLKPLPIAALCALDLPIPIAAEITARLHAVGVRTLGQLACLDELTLRRQFGAVGVILAALARGDAPTAFHPAPPESALRFRTHFSAAYSVEQTLRRLPGLASEIATRLHTFNQTTGALTLTIWWASGGVERIQHTLPEPTQATSALIQRFAFLLLSLARPPTARSASRCRDIERLEVRVGRLSPLRPQQGPLWSTPQHLRLERRRRIATLAEQLAQRYHRPALLTVCPTHEAATFSEDRYTLAPLTTTRADTLRPPAPLRPQRQRQEALIRPHWW